MSLWKNQIKATCFSLKGREKSFPTKVTNVAVNIIYLFVDVEMDQREDTSSPELFSTPPEEQEQLASSREVRKQSDLLFF